MKECRSHLQLLQLLVDTGQVLSLVHVDQLALQLAQPLVQALVALHQQVGLVGLEELAGFGLGGALQVLPALPDLLQLLPDHRAELGLLLDELLALLEGHRVRCVSNLCQIPFEKKIKKFEVPETSSLLRHTKQRHHRPTVLNLPG